MSIPFIRTLPDGRVQTQFVRRPRSVEQVASRFMAAGGRYFTTVLEDGRVYLTAVIASSMDPNNFVGVEDDDCHNDRTLPDKVDELVRRSEPFIGNRELRPVISRRMN